MTLGKLLSLSMLEVQGLQGDNCACFQSYLRTKISCVFAENSACKTEPSLQLISVHARVCRLLTPLTMSCIVLCVPEGMNIHSCQTLTAGVLTRIGECVLSIDAGWEEACLFSRASPSDLHS